ncbi:MAG: hypothetical protein OHK0040_12350 [bacterium]
MKIGKKDILVHKTLFYGILIILLFNFVAKRFLFTPLETKVAAMKSKAATLTSEKNNLAKEVASLKGKEAELKEKESRLTEYFLLKSRLVDFNRASQFLKNIVSYSGVKIQSLKPGKKEQIGQFKKWQINLLLSGTYTEINNYFNYLDRQPYLLNIKNVALSKGDSRGEVSANITLEAVGR